MLLQAYNALPKELSFIPVVVPFFGLLVPIILRVLEQRNRLKKAREFVDAIKVREELLGYKERFAHTEPNPILLHRTEIHLREIERSLFSIQRKKRIKLFVWLIVAEIVFFVTGIYFGILSFLQKILVGKSREHHIPFFEGIFAHPISRVILILLYLFISLYYMERMNKTIQRRYSGQLAYNLAMFALFNLFFVACVLVGSTFLYWLDYINPYF